MATPNSTTPETTGASASLGKMRFAAGYPDLLTVKHLRELTGLSEQTIRAEINSGKLPGCRIGRRLYVPKMQLIDYINEGGGLHEQARLH